MEIKVGMQGIVEDIVETVDTAAEVGSGSLLVYATPCMIAMMEGAACEAIDPVMPEGHTSVGIELNAGDMSYKLVEADRVLRMFKIAKAQGCKFYCGSDAHHPASFEHAKAIFERAIDMLQLTENDKFHIGE